MFTDEQLIKMAQKHMAEFPTCSRASLRRRCHSSYERLQRFADMGYFKMPVKCPKGKAHLFKQDDVWRKFKLWGSPEGKKK